jgi:hypothetical protein
LIGIILDIAGAAYRLAYGFTIAGIRVFRVDKYVEAAEPD